MLLTLMDQLKYLSKKHALLGRLERCHLLLAEFNITYLIQKSMKLAEKPVEG